MALPGWFAVPYLLFVVVQLFALNTFNLYSSGLTLQAIGLKLKRWKCTLIDLTICMILLFVIIFSQVFNTFLSEFLLTTIIWVAPWAAVFVVDWAMRRGNYDLLSLFGEGGAIYWRTRGVFLPGIAALVGGMVAAGLYINTELYVGPLSAATQNADFSAVAGLVVGGVLYYLLARRGVAEEVRQSSNAQPAAAAMPARQGRPPSAARMDSLLHKMGWASSRPRSSPGR
jgi:purine-cytosine permease-like protein